RTSRQIDLTSAFGVRTDLRVWIGSKTDVPCVGILDILSIAPHAQASPVRAPNEKRQRFQIENQLLVRSEELEPPRFYSLPPQGSASTNSATSAWLEDRSSGLAPGRINGADVTNREWGYKARTRLDSVEIWAGNRPYRVPGMRGSIRFTSTAMRLRSTSTTPL